jgi:RimJ/RimL family protein N-acetyltransferase
MAVRLAVLGHRAQTVTDATVAGETLTERLRLLPIGPEHAADLVAVHRDGRIAEWYAGAWPRATAEAFARSCDRGWAVHGVAKWMAYERASGALVGRGGLSRLASDSVCSQIAALVGPAWAERRLELGWAVVAAFRGQGLATEIGRAGLHFAFDTLGAHWVVAFTERHNADSRNVMHRLGLRLAGEIRARGLIEGGTGEHDNAPFAVYAIER